MTHDPPDKKIKKVILMRSRETQGLLELSVLKEQKK
jgi:hypothetical protein